MWPYRAEAKPRRYLEGLIRAPRADELLPASPVGPHIDLPEVGRAVNHQHLASRTSDPPLCAHRSLHAGLPSFRLVFRA